MTLRAGVVAASELLVDLIEERESADYELASAHLSKEEREAWSNLGAICDHAIALLRKAGAAEHLVSSVESILLHVGPKH